jgi:hypothetical protein
MTDVAERMVLQPIRQELSECSRFHAALRDAQAEDPRDTH